MIGIIKSLPLISYFSSSLFFNSKDRTTTSNKLSQHVLFISVSNTTLITLSAPNNLASRQGVFSLTPPSINNLFLYLQGENTPGKLQLASTAVPISQLLVINVLSENERIFFDVKQITSPVFKSTLGIINGFFISEILYIFFLLHILFINLLIFFPLLSPSILIVFNVIVSFINLKIFGKLIYLIFLQLFLKIKYISSGVYPAEYNVATILPDDVPAT